MFKRQRNFEISGDRRVSGSVMGGVGGRKREETEWGLTVQVDEGIVML